MAEMGRHVSYMGNHKVYCFKPSCLSEMNSDVKLCNSYEIGDYIPVIANNYKYNENLLVVDFAKRMVHIIEMCRYRGSVKIARAVDVDIFKHFNAKRYLSIDIHGNVISVKNIYDMYKVVNAYPRVNVYLEERKYAKIKMSEECSESFLVDDSLVVIDNVIKIGENGVVLSGYTAESRVKGERFCDNESVTLADEVRLSTLDYMIERFEGEFFDTESICMKVNILLDLLDVNYSLIASGNGKLVVNYRFGKKVVTHIEKIKREIRHVIDEVDEDELEIVLDEIFSLIEDESYSEYIIDTISSILDINV